jgi:hypothetical protein
MARPASPLVTDRIAAGHNNQGSLRAESFGHVPAAMLPADNGLDHLLD